MAKTNKITPSNILKSHDQDHMTLSLKSATSWKYPPSLGHLIAFLHTFPSYCALSDFQICYSVQERKYNYRRLSQWRKRFRYLIIALVVIYGGYFSWPLLFSGNLRSRLDGLAFTFWNIALYVAVRTLTIKNADDVLETIECLEFIQHLNPALEALTPKQNKLYRYIEWIVFICWLSWSSFATFVVDLSLLQASDSDVFLHVVRRIYNILRLHMPNVPDSFSLPWDSILLACVVTGIDFFMVMYAYMIDTIALVYTGVFYVAVNIACREVANIATRTHVALEDLNEIIAIFNRLQALSDSIKRTVGPVFAALCLAYLPYYCYRFQNVFDAKIIPTVPMITQGIVGVIVMAIFLCFSAESHAKIIQLGPCLTAMLEKIKFQNTDVRIDCNSKVHVILHNLSNGEFGIRSNFFTVTYSSVGALIEAVLTYSVIIFQIKNNSAV